MKKSLSIICMCTLLLSLCACGNKQAENGGNTKNFFGDKNGNANTVTKADSVQMQTGLSMLTHEVYPSCNTENGYYYIPDNMKELRDGSYGSTIMYMDFSTQKEVYLCNNAGCTHDTESCNAIIPEDEFSPSFGTMFTYNNKLYLLNCSAEMGETTSFVFSDSGIITSESVPDTLYRMNLDGTNREKVYTFDDGVSTEATVLGEGNSLYFVVKKLSESDAEASSNRQLVRYDISSGKMNTVASLNMESGSHWRVIGCSGTNVVLEGVVYPDDYSATEDYSASQWSEIFRNSKTKYVCLNVENGNVTSLYDVKNKNGHGGAVLDGALYVAEGSSEDILRIDLESGEQSILATLKQSNIIGAIGTKLVCRTWDMTENYYLYFVDTDNGNVSCCTLTNKYNGWALELVGETQEDAVVIYDYDADALSDGAYEIYRYKMALISKSDLYAGNDNFHPIEMIAGGR